MIFILKSLCIKKNFYLILFTLGLLYLFSILYHYPYVVPYVMDDYWYNAIGAHNSVVETFLVSAQESLRLGRASMILHSFLTATSFVKPVTARYFTQVLPLVFLIIMSGIYLGRSTKKELFLSFVALICFSTFYDNGHHLIGAYPTALPIGLSFSFLYFYLDSFANSQGFRIRLVRGIVFLVPFFLYEIFFLINGAYVCCRVFSQRASIFKNIKKYLPEIVLWLGFFILYFYLKKPSLINYDGVEVSLSPIAFLFAFIVFATGFIPTFDVFFLRILFLIVPLYYFFKKLHSNKCKLDGPELVFLLIWLIPPLIISSTVKYQRVALTESIYVTTYLSQIGFSGLCILFLFDLNDFWRKISVFFLCFFMLSYWTGHSSEVLRERYLVKDLIQAKLAALLSLNKTCITKGELVNFFPRFKHCAHKMTWQCDDITDSLALDYRLKMCEKK